MIYPSGYFTTCIAVACVYYWNAADTVELPGPGKEEPNCCAGDVGQLPRSVSTVHTWGRDTALPFLMLLELGFMQKLLHSSTGIPVV